MPCPRTQRHLACPWIKPATFWLLARFPNRSATWLPLSWVSLYLKGRIFQLYVQPHMTKPSLCSSFVHVCLFPHIPTMVKKVIDAHNFTLISWTSIKTTSRPPPLKLQTHLLHQYHFTDVKNTHSHVKTRLHGQLNLTTQFMQEMYDLQASNHGFDGNCWWFGWRSYRNNFAWYANTSPTKGTSLKNALKKEENKEKPEVSLM